MQTFAIVCLLSAFLGINSKSQLIRIHYSTTTAVVVSITYIYKYAWFSIIENPNPNTNTILLFSHVCAITYDIYFLH